MRAWLWLLVLAALIVLLVCSRLKVCGTYGAEGASLTVGFGVLTLLRLPGRKSAGQKREKKPKKQKDAEKNKAEKDRAEKNAGGSVPGFQALIPIITDVLGKLRRRLCVDELTFWYQSASEDPAAAALAFGSVNAAAGLLLQPLERLLQVKNRDFRTMVSFTEKKPLVYARVKLSIRLAALLYLGIAALIQYRRARQRALNKEET